MRIVEKRVKKSKKRQKGKAEGVRATIFGSSNGIIFVTHTIHNVINNCALPLRFTIENAFNIRIFIWLSCIITSIYL